MTLTAWLHSSRLSGLITNHVEALSISTSTAEHWGLEHAQFVPSDPEGTDNRPGNDEDQLHGIQCESSAKENCCECNFTHPDFLD